MKTLKSDFWLFVGAFVFLTLVCHGQESEVTDTPAAAGSESETESLKPGNVKLDFKDADINTVFRVLAIKGGVNIVASPDVKGTVTIRLTDVPWEQALKTILKNYNLTYEQDVNIIRVTTLENAKKEELSTGVFTLNFAKAKDVAKAIEDILSERGKLKYDERTNIIIVNDVAANLEKIKEVIKRLDRITRQVSIDARLIETVLNDADKLGINWTMQVAATGAKRPIIFPYDKYSNSPSRERIFPENARSITRSATGIWTYTSDFPLRDGYIPVTGAESVSAGTISTFPYAVASDFTFGTLDFTQFSAIMEVLKSRSDTNIVSNPRVTTLDNQEAKIIVGTNVPIPIYERNEETGSIEIIGYDDEQVGIQLRVVPQINEQDYITMTIEPKVSSITGFTGPNNERPITATREALTRVITKNGYTIAMGGLIKEQEVDSIKKIPVLGNIPVLGWLFKKKEKTKEKTDLLIFITPTIIKPDSKNTEEPQD